MAAPRPLMIAAGLTFLVACGDRNGSGTTATPTAMVTPTVNVTPTPSGLAGRAFAIGVDTVSAPSGATILRSDNGGESFAPVFETDALGPAGLRLAFIDELRGWAIGTRFGEETAHILHTTDGGVSWISQTENVELGSGVRVLLGDVVFSSPERGVAVGVVQQDLMLSAPPVILFTDNGGDDWSSVLALPRPAALGSACLTAVGTGLAVGSSAVSGPLVVRTDDGGATWRDITLEVDLNVGAELRTVSCTDTGRFWIGGKAVRFAVPSVPLSTVVFSPDDGATWVDRSLPSLTTLEDAVVSLDFTDEVNGWALAQGYTTVFHTEDAGATWVERALPDGALGTLQALDFRAAEHGVVVGFAEAPAGETPPALGFVTDDGGDTWRRAAIVSDDHVVLEDVVLVPSVASPVDDFAGTAPP